MSLHTAGKFEGSTVMRGFLQKACRAIKTCLLTSVPQDFMRKGNVAYGVPRRRLNCECGEEGQGW
ncbi:hypothetical protein IG631_12609 [Alternaria alternata]|nr:hypothetical protein IG631_12609 [Alternaria alternata]